MVSNFLQINLFFFLILNWKVDFFQEIKRLERLQKRHLEYSSWTQEYERVLRVESDLDKQLDELDSQLMTVRCENSHFDENESQIKQ